ncbi:MAG: single-stranded DNA-binding protein [Planctomycetaceae bacterium]|nr:single-stranded DNA-binding protein [Planctomycetaceae bacterium]
MSLFNSFNRVVIMGNITRDIELRTIPNGTRVTDIGVAVNERIKKGEQWVDDVTFVDVTIWGKTAELVERFGGKGKTILVEGRLRMDKWVDKTSGQNRSKLKVVADAVTFVDGAGKGGGGGARQADQGSDDMPYNQSLESDQQQSAVPF